VIYELRLQAAPGHRPFFIHRSWIVPDILRPAGHTRPLREPLRRVRSGRSIPVGCGLRVVATGSNWTEQTIYLSLAHTTRQAVGGLISIDRQSLRNNHEWRRSRQRERHGLRTLAVNGGWNFNAFYLFCASLKWTQPTSY